MESDFYLNKYFMWKLSACDGNWLGYLFSILLSPLSLTQCQYLSFLHNPLNLKTHFKIRIVYDWWLGTKSAMWYRCCNLAVAFLCNFLIWILKILIPSFRTPWLCSIPADHLIVSFLIWASNLPLTLLEFSLHIINIFYYFNTNNRATSSLTHYKSEVLLLYQ